MGRPAIYHLIPADVPPAMPGRCETCRSAPSRPGDAFCSPACAAFDRALAEHAEALREGDPTIVLATRTRLRAVADVYDHRHLPYRPGAALEWAEDVEAGLLADIGYAVALRLASLDMAE